MKSGSARRQSNAESDEEFFDAHDYFDLEILKVLNQQKKAEPVPETVREVKSAVSQTVMVQG